VCPKGDVCPLVFDNFGLRKAEAVAPKPSPFSEVGMRQAGAVVARC
jgi:hypothetical protein